MCFCLCKLETFVRVRTLSNTFKKCLKLSKFNTIVRPHGKVPKHTHTVIPRVGIPPITHSCDSIQLMYYTASAKWTKNSAILQLFSHSRMNIRNKPCFIRRQNKSENKCILPFGTCATTLSIFQQFIAAHRVQHTRIRRPYVPLSVNNSLSLDYDCRTT